MSWRLVGLSLVLATFHGQPASAGAYSDVLRQCLTAHLSEQDKAVYVQWMYAMVSANPVVRSLSSITDAQRQSLMDGAVKLTSRLMADDCAKEALNALKYEKDDGEAVILKMLADTSIDGLMVDDEVNKALDGTFHAKDEKLRALLRAAGVKE